MFEIFVGVFAWLGIFVGVFAWRKFLAVGNFWPAWDFWRVQGFLAVGDFWGFWRLGWFEGKFGV